MSQPFVAPMWSRYLVLVCSAGLLAIWTLPGTIALRHLFLGLGFISSLFIIRQNYSRLAQKSAWPVWLLALFYGWLLIHLAFLSQEFTVQLSELKSVWARSFMASLIGLCVGLLLQTNQDNPKFSVSMSEKRFHHYSNLVLFIGLSSSSWIIVGSYIFTMLQSGQGMQFDIYQFLYSLYRTKPAYVIFVSLSLPLCFILLLRSLSQQETKWWIVITLLTILVTPFGGFFIGSKNAMVIFISTAFLFLICFIRTFIGPSIRSYKASSVFKPLKSISALLIFLIIAFGATYGFQKHLERTNAWLALSDNVHIGMDIDHHDFWKNREVFPRPVNANGQLVDISTYERTAWFTAGVRLLKENPLGYGLTHHSFGTLALAKWPDFYKPRGNLKGATHSGWLDLALGVGIPGVSLIILCLLTSWIRCFKFQGIWFSYAAWTIPLILFTYLIAEMGEGHFLEILFFMTALFCGLTLPPQFKTEQLKRNYGSNSDGKTR